YSEAQSHKGSYTPGRWRPTPSDLTACGKERVTSRPGCDRACICRWYDTVQGLENTQRTSVPAWCQTLAGVRVTFRHSGHMAGSKIHCKYRGNAGAAGGYRTYDLPLTKGVLYH